MTNDQRTSTWNEGGEVLKFAMCLQTLSFLNNRSMVHFCKWGGAWVGGGGLRTSYCMIPNIKTYFDKKVTFLALVPSLLLNMYV